MFPNGFALGRSHPGIGSTNSAVDVPLQSAEKWADPTHLNRVVHAVGRHSMLRWRSCGNMPAIAHCISSNASAETDGAASEACNPDRLPTDVVPRHEGPFLN